MLDISFPYIITEVHNKLYKFKYNGKWYGKKYNRYKSNSVLLNEGFLHFYDVLYDYLKINTVIPNLYVSETPSGYFDWEFEEFFDIGDYRMVGFKSYTEAKRSGCYNLIKYLQENGIINLQPFKEVR